jgi:CRISPR/Cas system-associated exonuclease Cas4 (RecB family)
MTDERKNLPSASSMARLAACPGSWALSAKAPALPENEWSEDGRLIHEALESLSTKGLPSRLVSTCEVALERRHSMLAQWLIDRDIVADPLYNPRVMNEWRYWFKLNDVDVCSAKCDVLITCGTHGLILDYKSLYGDIDEPAHNAQLRTEVACVASEMRLTSIRVAIIQPAKAPVPPADYNAEDIRKAMSWLMGILTKAMVEDAPRQAGDHCQYCPARTICPEVDQQKGALSRPVRYDVLAPEDRAARIPVLKLGIKLASEELAFYKEALKKDPDYVTGYCLSAGRVEKPVNDITALYERVVRGASAQGPLERGGQRISIEDFMACCSVAKGKLEEKIAARSGLTGKALDELMEQIYSGILGSKQTEGSLAKKNE